MPLERGYGPNHVAVQAFLRSLDVIPWFTRLGQPSDRDDQLVRADFDFLVDHHDDPYAPWGESLLAAETRIEQLCFDHRRLGELAAIQEALRRRPPNPHIDDFYTGLLDAYPGYYKETDLYAHELVETPDRLILGVANEFMVADLSPDLKFFRSIMPWFEAGHWPCGWQGKWPDGRLILW